MVSFENVGASKLGLDQIEGEKTKESKGHPGIEGDAMGGDIESMHEIVALPGEIIPGTAGLESTKKISQAFQHKDGLHRDMPVQTLEDNTQKHPFFEILQRPATAPPRLDTRGMEVFVPLTKEENAIFQKQKLERKLASGLEGTSDDGEDIAGTDQEIKNLAASTIELLERSHFDLGLATKIRVLLSRLRQVKKVGVQGAAVGDDEEQEPEAAEIAVDEEDSSVASKKKGKKGYNIMTSYTHEIFIFTRLAMTLCISVELSHLQVKRPLHTSFDVKTTKQTGYCGMCHFNVIYATVITTYCTL
jgi:hypothetical protein